MEVMNDRVLLKKIEPELKTSSGFYIPVSDESVRATVIKVGPGRLGEDQVRIPVAVAAGDVVLYNVGAAISVTLDRETFLVVKEEDIIAIVGNE
jgi:chaperonin GroES